MILIPMLLACSMRGALPPVGAPQAIQAAPAAPIGPGHVSAGGLEVDVPEGWSGEPGPPGSGLVLWVVSEKVGTRVELWVFARGSGPPNPRPRPGCVRVFLDEVGTHRAVPGLGSSRAASCVSEDPTGPVVQGWYVASGSREAHVEVVHPAGRAVEGRAEVEPLLQSVRWSTSP